MAIYFRAWHLLHRDPIFLRHCKKKYQLHTVVSYWIACKLEATFNMIEASMDQTRTIAFLTADTYSISTIKECERDMIIRSLYLEDSLLNILQRTNSQVIDNDLETCILLLQLSLTQYAAENTYEILVEQLLSRSDIVLAAINTLSANAKQLFLLLETNLKFKK